MDKLKILNFVDNLIDEFKEAETDILYECSGDIENGLNNLENHCKSLRNKIRELLEINTETDNGIPKELFKFDIRKTLLDCEEKGTIGPERRVYNECDNMSRINTEACRINDDPPGYNFELSHKIHFQINLIKIFEDQYGPLPGSIEDKIKYIKENIIIKE